MCRVYVKPLRISTWQISLKSGLGTVFAGLRLGLGLQTWKFTYFPLINMLTTNHSIAVIRRVLSTTIVKTLFRFRPVASLGGGGVDGPGWNHGRDTGMKYFFLFLFCGWIWKEHWRNDVGGWEFERTAENKAITLQKAMTKTVVSFLRKNTGDTVNCRPGWHQP